MILRWRWATLFRNKLSRIISTANKRRRLPMNKVIQYLLNMIVAIAHVPLAVAGKYVYNPNDSYLRNLLITALDLPLNTILGGDPNETLSSRSGKAQVYEQEVVKPPVWGWGCRLCSFLAVFQEDHCAKAIRRNRGKDAVVPDESNG